MPASFMCMHDAHGGQKRGSGLLRLGLQMIVSYHIMLGTELGSSAKATSTLNP